MVRVGAYPLGFATVISHLKLQITILKASCLDVEYLGFLAAKI